MKKDRNSFFNESSYSYGGYIPNNNMMPMQNPNMIPTQTGSFNQSFYSGPGYGTNQGMYDNSDIESRLSKIERQLNRIDSRLTKLENTTNVTTENFENTTNMYMV